MTWGRAHSSPRGSFARTWEADPPGVRLYRRLGFVDEFESLRFRGKNTGRVETGGAKAMPSNALRHVTSFDAGVFRDDRGEFLRFFHARAIAAYWMGDAGSRRAGLKLPEDRTVLGLEPEDKMALDADFS